VLIVEDLYWADADRQLASAAFAGNSRVG